MEKKLPTYGVGPLYGIVVIALTVLGVVISQLGFIQNRKHSLLQTPLLFIGIIIIVYGISIWWRAVFKVRVDDYINMNKLCTSGVYGIVRNPCYSAVMLICTGVLLMENNMWLLVLPIIFWIFMTILMRNTEEKWLTELYGQQYLDYCKKVNRCIPWFKQCRCRQ